VINTTILKLWVVLVLFVFAGCMQSINSNSNDDNFRPSRAFDLSTPEGQRYSAAMSVIQNKCISCHSADWSGFNTEAAWIASGRVVKNNSLSSSLYYRNKGSGGSLGAKNMPPIGSLSVAELSALASWIDEML